MIFLDERGFDGTYWSTKFQEECSVTNRQQIQYLGERDLNQLVSCTRLLWEEQALRDLFLDCGAKDNNQNREHKELIRPNSVQSFVTNNTNQSIVENKPEIEFDRLLRELNLNRFHTTKISLQQVMAITDREGQNCTRMTEIAFELLRQLIMLEWESRDNILQTLFETTQVQTSVVPSGLDSLYGSVAHSQSFVHPQDLFLIVFLFCDQMLKETLMQKLPVCGLSLPFVYPTLSGGQLEFPLWCLRSIIIEWKRGHSTNESCIVNAPLHVVSFCRLGKSTNFSKSKLLNDIINSVSHPTFYHRDCQGASSKRLISDGTIEAAWFIPSDGEGNPFENVTLFLNLRGNGVGKITQMSLLAEISSVIVVPINV